MVIEVFNSPCYSSDGIVSQIRLQQLPHTHTHTHTARTHARTHTQNLTKLRGYSQQEKLEPNFSDRGC
jgi:hypothetical protein